MLLNRRDMMRLMAGAGIAPGIWQLMNEDPDSRAQDGAKQADGGSQSGQASKAIPEPLDRIARFERMGFGMFIHWGLYSQLGKGEWAMNNHRIPKKKYMELMRTFTAKDFDGRELARLAKRAGMKYATHTSRHHDGFSLYDTKGLSKLDITHTPAGRDLIEDFVAGCRAEGIVPMLYCTTLDWSDARFKNDWKAYQQYLRESVELLCTRYGDIGGFWFDGNWSNKKADWEEDALYAVIRKHQPDALIFNNTGIQHGGKVGNPEIDSVTYERGRPSPMDRRGQKKYLAAEMCHTMNFHWGVAESDFNYLSPAHVIEELCVCRRAGANLLMNLGPGAQGGIPAYEKAAFERVGDWIRMHGGDSGAIYQGRPCGVTGEGRDFALELDGVLHGFVFDLTATANTAARGSKARGPGKRRFKNVNRDLEAATWLDNGQKLKVTREGGDAILHATKYPYGTNTVVRVARFEG